MELKDQIKEYILNAIKDDVPNLKINDIEVENAKEAVHGDFCSNIALKLAKTLHKSPMEIANKIASKIREDNISKIEVATPGFINFFMNNNSLKKVIDEIHKQKDNFGRSKKNNLKVNVEFVSANPTGPLHVGHARGAAIGDSICRILDFAGYEVTREYYINDAGSQINNLALSLLARTDEALGLPFSIPQDGYHGEDIKNIAKLLIKDYGIEKIKGNRDIDFFKKVGMKYELDNIIKDLEAFNVSFDVFSSEIVVRSNNSIEKEINFLSPFVYEEQGAKMLSTSKFLDDKDRVIIKSNGDYTYFLPDIVYHLNKLNRGFDLLIDILGADHHGYINRMKSALMMHGYKADVLDVELIQMVRIMKDGEEIVASKRTGNAYTLRELIDDVGVDAARYFFIMRAASTHLDFDIDLALEESNNNPVYYAQYAHARLCSLLNLGEGYTIDYEGKALKEKEEIELIKTLNKFPSIVLLAASEKAPYRMSNYIHELAEKIHSFYSTCRVIDSSNIVLTSSRLGLCSVSRQVLKNGLGLIGVSAPTHM